MKLKYISATVAIALIMPFAAAALTADDIQAQIASLLAQITRLQQQLKQIQITTPVQPPPDIAPTPPRCPIFTRTLAQGTTGDDVTQLQQYLGVSPTGYFGPMTAKAVSAVQADAGISQVGIVGPATRAWFYKRCGGGGWNQNFSASPTSGVAPLTVNFTGSAPSSDFDPNINVSRYSISFGDGTSGVAEDFFDCPAGGSCGNTMRLSASHTYTSNGTYVAKLRRAQELACDVWINGVRPDCDPYKAIGTVTIYVGGTTGSGTPSISGIDAPSSLNVGQTGTWTVHASVNGPDTNLRYSVIWGDEPAFDQIQAFGNAAGVRALQTSSTFTHAYSSAGTYKPTFTVSNTSGSAQTSASVSVGGTTGGSNFSASPTSGGAPLTVQFSATNIDTAWNTYTLNYGDGSQITIGGCGNNAPCYNFHNGNHTYTAAGTYTATLVGRRMLCDWGLCDLGTIGTVTITVGVNFGGGSCIYNGQTYPPGTILPFTPYGGYTLQSSSAIPASAMQMVNSSVSSAYAIAPSSVRYRCTNGDWVRVYDEYVDPCPTCARALKPVIYLYPTSTQVVTAQLKFAGELSSTYPAYDAAIQGWRVLARPDGTLTNLADNREYSYLFWEGENYPLKIDETKGFIVKGSDARVFLQTKLAELGLTPREYNEFIVFWLPKMEHNPYNFVQFVGSEYTDMATLNVSPTPDSVLRVFMAFKPLNQPISVTPQSIQPFERKGFSVVEWGGAELQ